jgi:hypothetical protein
MKESTMKIRVIFMVLMTPTIFGVAGAAASAPGAHSQRSKTVATETQLMEPANTAPSTPDSYNHRHIFPVNDDKGLLLTCIAPEIETDVDSDLFTNCTLAPGRTLDDVMHSFVAALHYVQKERMKERGESNKYTEEKSNETGAQK